MKKAYILTVILMTFKGTLFSQEILSIFTYDEWGKIEINSQFVSIDDGLDNLSFSTVSIDSLSMDTTNYVIKIGRFQDWENEPGDFDVIQFYQHGEPVLTYKDASGVVKINDPQNGYAYPFHSYSDNGYFIKQNLANRNKILLFIGQHYGSDHARLIIFVVASQEIQLVYNQSVAILSLHQTAENFCLVVQSNMPDIGEKIIKHAIYTEDEKLKFKDLSE